MISSRLNALILLFLLLAPREISAQLVDDGKNPPPLSKDDPPETNPDYLDDPAPFAPFEPYISTPSPSTPDKESQLILEKQDDINLHEGIEDAFAKDNGDKFQSKNKEQSNPNN